MKSIIITSPSSVMAELKKRHREYFESKLAIALLSEPALFSSIQKISIAITAKLIASADLAKEVIAANLNIAKYLYGADYFGRLELQAKPALVAPEKVYTDILRVLAEHSDLSQVMQIHCVFIHCFFDKISSDHFEDKAYFVNKVFHHTLFLPAERGRKVLASSGESTTHLGITHHPVFTKKIDRYGLKFFTCRRQRALDNFGPDNDSSFIKRIEMTHIPFVAGASGHTGSLLLGAKLYGHLSEVEFYEYTHACFAFLAAGGNHSYHEVMSVAALYGVEYELDRYLVPASLLKGGAANLVEEFPEFIAQDDMDAPERSLCHLE